MTDRVELRTEDAPPTASFMVQGIRRGRLVQGTGQGPFKPGTNEFVGGSIEEQTIQTLENLEAILVAGGATFRDVLVIRAYLTSRDNYDRMNATYERFLSERLSGDPFPARTCVMTGFGHPEMLVEIDALAVVE